MSLPSFSRVRALPACAVVAAWICGCTAARDSVTSSTAAVDSLAPIDFCGDGVDQNNDGSDACDDGEGFPVTQTLTIVDVGPSTGVALVPAALQFGPGKPFVHLVNASAFEIDFSGNLTPGKLAPRGSGPVPDEITLPVGLPGKISVSPYPGSVVEAPLTVAAAAGDESRFALLGGPLGASQVELTLLPDDGSCPVMHPNDFRSIDACVGKATCSLRVQATLRTVDAAGNLVSAESFGNACPDYATETAQLSWDGSAQTVKIDLYRELYRGSIEYHFVGGPGGVKGRRALRDGSSYSQGPDLSLSFRGSSSASAPPDPLDGCVIDQRYGPTYAYCKRSVVWDVARETCLRAKGHLVRPSSGNLDMLGGLLWSERGASLYVDDRRAKGTAAYVASDGSVLGQLDSAGYLCIGKTCYLPRDPARGNDVTESRDNCLALEQHAAVKEFDCQSPRGFICELAR